MSRSDNISLAIISNLINFSKRFKIVIDVYTFEALFFKFCTIESSSGVKLIGGILTNIRHYYETLIGDRFYSLFKDDILDDDDNDGDYSRVLRFKRYNVVEYESKIIILVNTIKLIADKYNRSNNSQLIHHLIHNIYNLMQDTNYDFFIDYIMRYLPWKIIIELVETSDCAYIYIHDFIIWLTTWLIINDKTDNLSKILETNKLDAELVELLKLLIYINGSRDLIDRFCKYETGIPVHNMVIAEKNGMYPKTPWALSLHVSYLNNIPRNDRNKHTDPGDRIIDDIHNHLITRLKSSSIYAKYTHLLDIQGRFTSPRFTPSEYYDFVKTNIIDNNIDNYKKNIINYAIRDAIFYGYTSWGLELYTIINS